MAIINPKIYPDVPGISDVEDTANNSKFFISLFFNDTKLQHKL